MNRLAKSSAYADETVALDLTPLIDVVFILLLFFLVISRHSEQSSIALKLPGAASGQRNAENALRILVDRHGTIAIHSEPLDLSELSTRVRNEGQKTVVVMADRDLSTGVLVRVIDHARQGGASDVAVATMPLASP